MVTTKPSVEQVYQWLAEVPDPEIPVLSILDLGIVRDVAVGGGVTVTLTPTYSGCPATEVIESSVAAVDDRLDQRGRPRKVTQVRHRAADDAEGDCLSAL